MVVGWMIVVSVVDAASAVTQIRLVLLISTPLGYHPTLWLRSKLAWIMPDNGLYYELIQYAWSLDNHGKVTFPLKRDMNWLVKTIISSGFTVVVRYPSGHNPTCPYTKHAEMYAV